MVRHGLLLAISLILATAPPCPATAIAKKTRKLADTREQLTNANLERVVAQRFENWSAYDAGYAVDQVGGRGGKPCALCDNTSGTRKLGLSQIITLNQTDAQPLVISGWSKAEGVQGYSDADYSLYVDMIYNDGTPYWGQVAAFSCGTHDWEYRRFWIHPAKPVKVLTVNVLFRGRKGKAWFDDISVKVPEAGPDSVMFDDVSVQRRGDDSHSRKTAEIHIRDVAADSDFLLIPIPEKETDRVEIAELQLAVAVHRSNVAGGHHRTDITVTDLAHRDRAITVYYVVPLDATGWQWFDNVRHSRVIAASQEYHNTVHMGVGATGRTSRYPFACVAGRERARSLLVTTPSVCHLGYNAGTAEMYAAFDIGLVKETKRPGCATVTVYDAETDPRWGLRDTARLFYELLPQYFDRGRVPRPQGNWMAFQKISSLKQPEDFHFAVHEGNNDVRWDNDHGVQPYVYVEPMTWWLPLPKKTPRTYDTVMELVRSFKADPKSFHHDIAWATSLSGTFERDGRYRADLLDTPWCNGAVFGNSADPDVPEPPGHLNLAHLNMRNLEQALKKAESAGGLAGIYLDSLEGWGRLLNHRREHYAAADIPLTFDADTFRPVILNAFSTLEFTAFISDWIHRRGKLLMANAVPNKFPFLALPLDLLGTETNWQQNGRFVPPDPDYLYVKRTLSWHKPYMFLMNSHFETWTMEMTERYMRICLFYGMFPGFFSENAATNCYFANPAWYDRDRPLFRKYLPVIRRVAEAGWEPITLSRSDSDDVWIERWGSEPSSGLFFTVMNSSDQPRSATVNIEMPAASKGMVKPILGGQTPAQTSRITLKLPAHGVEVLQVRAD